jgi:hypothetical protein
LAGGAAVVTPVTKLEDTGLDVQASAAKAMDAPAGRAWFLGRQGPGRAGGHNPRLLVQIFST